MLSFLIAGMPFSRLFSNKLAISPVSYSQGAGTVTFDLSWQNSWRTPLPTTSDNWDAAWVFIKWRDCTAPANTQFTHGLISTTLGDHNFNVLSGGTTFEPTLADGSAVGIDLSPNNTGVMLRNVASPYNGNVSARVTLQVTNLPASGTLDVRVYGIEMVFVQQGAYSLGDGNSTNKSTQSFASSSGGSTSITISSESAQTIYESSALLGSTQNLTAAFPKGYGAFYIMKYEITQGQYVDFLNASPSLVQSMHFPNNNAANRHTISNSSPPGTFTVSRPFRACNFLSWADFGTYLDWAALRPLTELEYEKSCKGTAPVSPYDNAMGVAFATRAVSISGAENGTETISVPGGANICAGTTAFTGSGDGGQGPLRGGIFATAGTSSRNQTGASFYGVMELSGNVDEYYVSSIAGVNGGISSFGIVQGDGVLDDATGQFNNFGWPASLFPGNMIIHRGGHWNTTNVTGGTAAGQLNVSDRQGGALTTRVNTAGGRGGRSVTGTAPSLSPPLTINYTGYMQYFTVPAGTTLLTIEAWGAGGAGATGGAGAKIIGTCSVTPGEVLQVLVGGTGITAGGGGGSFVVRAPYNTLASALVVAGGGGGSTSTANANSQGRAANVTTTGNGIQGGSYVGCTTTNNTGGSGGTGGLANPGSCPSAGGGGGGFTGNGTNGTVTAGLAYINGGTGGSNGGYGGGGGGGSSYGGGGGGYSGGSVGYSGSTTYYYGGGGGSINRGTTQTNTQGGGSAANTAGKVVLTW